MGVFDELKKQESIQSPVVKARKKLHKGFLFGHISNGGGIIKLDDEYALKFVAIDNNFVKVFLLDYGKDLEIETQTWNKTKEIEKKPEQIIITQTAKKKDLF